MQAFLPAGINSVVSGLIVNHTVKIDVIKNTVGKVIALNLNQYNYNQTSTFLYWKLDESISMANDAFERGNLEEAQRLYAIAIESNLENSYLKNMLSHVTYMIAHDTESILQQNKKYAGSYGPRNFWLEDGKFYYKRKSEDSELAKVELLPISEHTYMDLTRLNVLMHFQEGSDNSLNSKSSQYSLEKKEWLLLDTENNVFPKDK